MSSSDFHIAPAPEDALATSGFKPEVRWHRAELIGFIVLAVLPILAVFGVFGPTLDETHAENGSLRIEVEYPSRMRFHMVEHLVVRVKNIGSVPLTNVQVSFSSAYIQSFTDVVFTPEVKQAYLVPVEPVGSGETALVSVEVRADEYGWRSGVVSIANSGQELTLPVNTLVFP